MQSSSIVLMAFASCCSAPRPHLVMILTDDNGWAGVGYNNPYLHTPALDSLAEDGLKLTRHYTYRFCAPTRGSLLTGRMPWRLSAIKKNYIPWHMPDGTDLRYAMLPQKLKSAGYTSVHIGKWHQGLYAPAFTPVGRGFHRTYGFLEGGEDHNTSRTFGNWCDSNEVDLSQGAPDAAGRPFPYTWDRCVWTELGAVALHHYYVNSSTDIDGYAPYSSPAASVDGCKALCEGRVDCAGYSYRVADPSHQYFHKCFLVSAIGDANHSASAATFTSATCARPSPPTTQALLSSNGTYTGYLFAEEAVRTITAHDSRTPLFLYLALHNTHAPLEAPWRFVERFAAFNDSKRAAFSGMLSVVDETVANVTHALKASGMWPNTLLVWTNDNGSPVQVGGSNHPLRGGKGSNWEGGTRVPAFVNGGLLPAAQRGKSQDGLLHIADWHATFAELAGIDPTAGEPRAVAVGCRQRVALDFWPHQQLRPPRVDLRPDSHTAHHRTQPGHLPQCQRRMRQRCDPAGWLEAGRGTGASEHMEWLVFSQCLRALQHERLRRHQVPRGHAVPLQFGPGLNGAYRRVGGPCRRGRVAPRPLCARRLRRLSPTSAKPGRGPFGLLCSRPPQR